MSYRPPTRPLPVRGSYRPPSSETHLPALVPEVVPARAAQPPAPTGGPHFLEAFHAVRARTRPGPVATFLEGVRVRRETARALRWTAFATQLAALEEQYAKIANTARAASVTEAYNGYLLQHWRLSSDGQREEAVVLSAERKARLARAEYDRALYERMAREEEERDESPE